MGTSSYTFQKNKGFKMFMIAALVNKKKLERGKVEIVRPPIDPTVDNKMRKLHHQKTRNAFEFNIDDEKSVRRYIMKEYGPGYYRVYKWGGWPPHEEFLTKDDGTFGPDIVDGRRLK